MRLVMSKNSEKKRSIKDRKELYMQFLKGVKTYPFFLELEEKASSDGALSKKSKELIALSINDGLAIGNRVERGSVFQRES